MASLQQFDVVIVGAGPAGCASAIVLADAGFSVALVDKSPPERVKPCGEALGTAAQEELTRLGIFEQVVSQGVWAERIQARFGGSKFEWERKGKAFLMVPREKLQEALEFRVLKAGASLVRPVRVTSVREEGDSLSVLMSDSYGRKSSFKASFVVIATGAVRSLHRHLGLVNGKGSAGWAGRGYLEIASAGLPPIVRVADALDGFLGYSWAFPLPAGRWNVGLGVLKQARASVGKNLRSAILERLPVLLDGCSGEPEDVRAHPVIMDWAAVKPARGRVLVVGEAAGLVDPLVGAGIGWALVSGRWAGEAILRAMEMGVGAEAAGKIYTSKVISQAYPQLQSRLSLREALRESRHALRVVGFGTGEEGPPELPPALAGALMNAMLEMLKEAGRVGLPKQVSEMLARGKMIRGRLALEAMSMIGRSDNAGLHHLVAGLEFMHAASLIHDDIVDDAGTRRGLKALHVSLGRNEAMVVGDQLIALAFGQLARCSQDPETVRLLLEEASEVMSRICAGQLQDMEAGRRTPLTLASWLRIARLKTASAFEGALRWGALVAGADASLLKPMSLAGRLLGLMFQATDDVLEWEEAVGGFAPDRRPALPLALAVDSGRMPVAGLAASYLAGEAVSAAELALELKAAGIMDRSKRFIEKLAGAVYAVLGKVELPSERLQAFVRYIKVRRS